MRNRQSPNQNVWSLGGSIPRDTNWATFGFSSATTVTLFAFRRLLDPLCKRFTWIPHPPPIELFCIAFSSWLAFYFDLSHRWQLPVLGHIPAGLPRFQPPPIVQIVDWPLVVDALLISFLITAITLSLVKLYAPEDQSSQPNRQLVALGFANVFSCCFGCFPSAPSLSRSSVLRSSSNCTLMANVYSSAFLLFVILYFGPLFTTLPKVSKSGINVLLSRNKSKLILFLSCSASCPASSWSL
jgi:MFS superfamily sulfate permease-like transporter